MEIITMVLLALLFIVSLINIYLNFHYKNNPYAWLKSLLHVKPSSPSSSSSSSSHALNGSSSVQKQKSAPQQAELKKVFATFDKNGDGFITKQELKESLKNIRILVSDKEVEEMVVKVDANGDGLIDFEEFCILCEVFFESSSGGHDNGKEGENNEEINGGDQEGDLKEAFDVFDKDKDGLISVEELGLVLCSLGLKEGKKMEDCKEMIRKVDMDGDGMVNFDEFKIMMKSGGGGLLVSAF